MLPKRDYQLFEQVRFHNCLFSYKCHHINIYISTSVHAFNAIPEEETRFGKKISNILSLARKEALATGGFNGSMSFIGNLTIIGLLTYGGNLVSAGEITVG